MINNKDVFNKISRGCKLLFISTEKACQKGKTYANVIHNQSKIIFR